MNQVFVPGDAVTPAKAFLSAELAGQAQVRRNLPSSWTATDGPVLVVANDPGTEQFPVATTQVVRLTAYTAGQTIASDLIRRAWGLLLCKPVPGLASVRPGVAPFDAGKDKEHVDALVSSATVRAVIRTTAL